MKAIPFAACAPSPGETSPEIWILGSSNYGAQVAAHFGLPYAFAWFFTDGAGGMDALRLYRELYKPSARYPKPHAALCVWALAAETTAEAEYHYSSRAHFRLNRDRGKFLPLEDPAALAKHTYPDEDLARLASYRSRAFVGTGAEVATKINALATETGVDEIAIVAWAYNEAARVESYRLIAREFSLA